MGPNRSRTAPRSPPSASLRQQFAAVVAHVLAHFAPPTPTREHAKGHGLDVRAPWACEPRPLANWRRISFPAWRRTWPRATSAALIWGCFTGVLAFVGLTSATRRIRRRSGPSILRSVAIRRETRWPRCFAPATILFVRGTALQHTDAGNPSETAGCAIVVGVVLIMGAVPLQQRPLSQSWGAPRRRYERSRFWGHLPRRVR